MRASAPDFAKKFNILRDAGLPPRDDQIGPSQAREHVDCRPRWMLQPSLAKTLVSSSSTSRPDATNSAVFCVAGATALLQEVVMCDPT